MAFEVVLADLSSVCHPIIHQKARIPNLRWLADLVYFPQTWLAEAYVTDHLSPLSYLYDIETAAHFIGYNLHAYALDLSWAPLLWKFWQDTLLILAFWPDKNASCIRNSISLDCLRRSNFLELKRLRLLLYGSLYPRNFWLLIYLWVSDRKKLASISSIKYFTAATVTID